MKKNVVDINRINEVLKKTIESINKGKEEIFDIAESARKECESIKRELAVLKERVAKLVKEVDVLEIEEKNSRKKLMAVSKNFKHYTEEDIKKAYDNAKNLQVLLMLKRQEEKDLINKRKELEIRLINAEKVLKKAERLVTQVGVALEYLSGNLNDLSETIEDMQKKQLLGIKILKAQEEERQRVARDIHDGPAQSLANVVIKTEVCERLLDIDVNKARNELKNLKHIVRESLKDIRKIIYDLRPMSIDDLGFIPTIKRYAYNFSEETGINAEVLVIGQFKSMESIVEITLFRIIQEALNNIKKHSKAKNVQIKIETTLKSINIVVKDDGIGFDVEKKLNDTDMFEGGFGILGMKERVDLLKGEFQIISSIGRGTNIIFRIPIDGKDD
ncbi:histidine kinase [Caloranaerobacter sp. TR13]|uniref:sensor histidine kinase n=1 Tax=Caloranaerobacter sp. TR13 TaxID=1302151 RepID=UPI0006D48D72|nr:sensor histidine kinase [Caloranaerobacter sp. TR13]KPU27820.1 histidine kinase [Caloranaerobacter sp. TR13]